MLWNRSCEFLVDPNQAVCLNYANKGTHCSFLAKEAQLCSDGISASLEDEGVSRKLADFSEGWWAFMNSLRTPWMCVASLVKPRDSVLPAEYTWDKPPRCSEQPPKLCNSDCVSEIHLRLPRLLASNFPSIL